MPPRHHLLVIPALAVVTACATGTATPGAATSAPSPSSATRTAPVACSTQPLHRKPGPVTFTATLGEVSATLSAVSVKRGYMQWLAQPVLTVDGGGAAARAAVRPAPFAYAHRYFPLPVTFGKTQGYVCLARFTPDAAPTAVVSVYAGGAHCCTTFRLVDGADGRQTHVDTGNAGGGLALADGDVVVKTRDDAFSYAFADFADSGAPVRLLVPSGHGVADVTRQHPSIVRADARFQWRLARARTIRLGFLAAWAADQEMLGHDGQVWPTLERVKARGWLSVPRAERVAGWPTGDRYLAKLRTFLARHGYSPA